MIVSGIISWLVKMLPSSTSSYVSVFYQKIMHYDIRSLCGTARNYNWCEMMLQYEKFGIAVARTGELKLIQRLDYESLPSGRKYYDLKIHVRVS